MTNILLVEVAKLFASVCVLVCIIYLLQRKYERTANQFILNEHEPIHHSKDYMANSKLPACPLYPANLTGVSDVDVYTLPTFAELKKRITNLEKGGFHRPRKCVQREKLAIIIPYRDRHTNLVLLLKYLHPLLQKQLRYYRIILVEQYGDDIFNKGRIMNIAVREALKLDDFDCFIFHDVDLIPENDRNIYECYDQPRHLSPAVDELRYNLMYYNLVGGVLALNLDQLNRTNGYSNLYWGWGAEDDDMSMRILDSGLKITRPTNRVGRYKMILHGKRSRAVNRFELLEYWKRYPVDGLSSLHELNYTVAALTYDYLYTNITVNIGPSSKSQQLLLNKQNIQPSKFKFY